MSRKDSDKTVGSSLTVLVVYKYKKFVVTKLLMSHTSISWQVQYLTNEAYFTREKLNCTWQNIFKIKTLFSYPITK